MLRKFFMKLKEGTEHLNFGRHIVRKWGSDLLLQRAAHTDRKHINCRALDLGCGHGTDLLNVKADVLKASSHKNFIIKLVGLENYKEYVKECEAANIIVHSIDLEHEEYPGEDGAYDLVIANQVLEHTKEIFWIFEEVARIIKPGGRFIVGVPNLASLHNRLLLLFGRQPTSQQTLSAHVRTFTKHDFIRFAETGGYFKCIDFKGSNFYPFGPSLSMPLSRLFPSCAWGIFFLLERTEKVGSFLDCLKGDANLLETPYYGSPQNPPKRKWKLFGQWGWGL